MYYIRVTEGKNEELKKRRQNDNKLFHFHLRNILCLSEGVHEI